ncbi:MAG: S-layer homology domain-containing protein, partial [Oscillospiraceae bacterium]|nr:S-layer homology domain-containing protein [Oscillospiraceae bacterium]
MNARKVLSLVLAAAMALTLFAPAAWAANNQTITIGTGAVVNHPVYGNGNTLDNGAADWGPSDWPTTATENTVNINSDGTVNGDVYGGVAALPTAPPPYDVNAELNKVNINSGTVNGDVYGGYGGDKHKMPNNATAGGANKSNTVTINGGTVNGDVYGGYAEGSVSATASYNKVIISSGTYEGVEIQGGHAEGDGEATANGNTVTISGGTFEGGCLISGGLAYSSGGGDTTASGNTVTIQGNTTFNSSGLGYPILKGGEANSGGTTVSANNTLNLSVKNLQAQKLADFQTMNFTIPNGFSKNADTMITVSGSPADLADVTAVGLAFAATPTLAVGEQFTLIGNVGGTYNGNSTTTASGYTFELSVDDSGPVEKLVARVIAVPATTYAVTYHANTGTGTAPTESAKAAGAKFTAKAATGLIPPEGKKFKEWNTQSGGTGTSYAPGATVTMPAGALILYAIWEDDDDGGEIRDPDPTPPAPSPENPPEEGPSIIGYGGTVNRNRTLKIAASFNARTGLVTPYPTGRDLETLIGDARSGAGTSGVRAVTLDATGIDGVKSMSLDPKTLSAFAEANGALQIKLHGAGVILSPETLETLATQAGRQAVTVEASVVAEKDLTKMQAAQVRGYGTVVNIDVFVGKEKVDVPVTISMPYTLKADEDPKAVCVWHLSGDGELRRLDGVYDGETGCVLFAIGHQSCFVSGYDPVALWENRFTDVDRNHPFYDAIAYASYYSGILFAGTSETAFDPDGVMTRGDFMTVLYKLAGRPAYSEGYRNFGDVKAGDYYYDAILWGANTGIVAGKGGDRFAPSDALSRQEMAVILYKYATKAAKYTIPQNRGAQTFDKMDGWAATQAGALGRAGMLTSGGSDLTGDASRAEIARMFMDF